mmetsp:Transcript_4280/g.19442  ORF Transcript_4280/g.19442 Transcript_4280/m.19442 type:complete len:198 (-) Transcript_4280:55-648(-)
MFAVMGRTAAVPVRSVGRVAVGASRMTVARAPSVAGGRPAARSMRLIGDDDRARSVVARAADDEPAAASAPAAGEPEFAFEPKKKIRPRRDGSKTKRAKIKVEGMAIEAAKGTAPVTFASASEEAYILFLFAYIVVIFGAGLFLAVSAFGILPENVDNWVTETLYPAYSPIVIGFLLFSSVYGLVKTRNDPDSASGR